MKFTFSENTLGVAVELSDEKITYFTGAKLMIGGGPMTDLNRRKIINILRQIIQTAKQYRIKVLNIDQKVLSFKLQDQDLGELLATNMLMANYEYNDHKTKPDEGWNFVEEIVLRSSTPQFQKGVERGLIIGEEVNRTRSLSNMPPGIMTPLRLADAAIEATRGLPHCTATVLDRKEMQKLKMGAVLGVAQGSTEEPKFIVLEYNGNPSAPPLKFKGRSGRDSESEGPVVLIGKGVTFDSGGLNIKPSEHIYEMHMDMSGGAAVIHAIAAAARLGIKRNIVGLIPAVENMPSGSSYHPGDVLKSMSGKTIEVLDTDAEGRVILADALEYAKQYKPSLVVDVATLTGAAEVALGDKASAIFSKDEKLIERVRELGEQSGDYVWPLPLWDEFEEGIKGTFGDWANVGKKRRSGGAIDGAMFLYQFIKNPLTSSGQAYNWLHIDMAPRMTASEGEFLAKGAIGTPVRLLLKILEEI